MICSLTRLSFLSKNQISDDGEVIEKASFEVELGESSLRQETDDGVEATAAEVD